MTLPPDPEDFNDERANLAAVALNAYTRNAFHDRKDPDAATFGLRDLLCNLRHWADRNGKDWEAELAAAMDNYQEETLDPVRPRLGG
jgi:hypothetical protein